MTNKTKTGASKLNYKTAQEIKDICSLTKLTDPQIADIYGVSRVLVNHIRHNRRWTDVSTTQEKEMVCRPLKMIHQMMTEYELDSLEYQGMTIFMLNTPRR